MVALEDCPERAELETEWANMRSNRDVCNHEVLRDTRGRRLQMSRIFRLLYHGTLRYAAQFPLLVPTWGNLLNLNDLD